MTSPLSSNTQAILLLTAPLIAGKGSATSDLLSPGEYKRLARHLRELQRQPADLLAQGAAELLRACQPVVDGARLERLLARGFLLSQVIERWQTRAIWVVSRADAHYPRRLKARLREDAPAVLYGCGDIKLLETGGLAVVGSRHVNDSLIDYTTAIGKQAALAGRTIVSGGAKGVDQAAMRGAWEASGIVSGVVADSLEKTAMHREHRNLLLEGRLVLVSPYDPSAGFNVGNAMQRNKLIYALADASLIVEAELNKGGTWAGAVEQLDKFKFVPVYVRSTGELSAGLKALQSKGARSWPNPESSDALVAVFEMAPEGTPSSLYAGLSLFDQEINESTMAVRNHGIAEPSGPIMQQPDNVGALAKSDASVASALSTEPGNLPADALFEVVRTLLQQLLRTPKQDSEVAAALNVSASQAKAWLQRLADEGVLEVSKRPAGYVVRQGHLFK